MRTLLFKEFKWNWRSFRFPALLLVFLFFALLNPPSSKYMNEIIAYFSEIELALPAPTPEEAFTSVLSDISQIGIVVLIFVAMGIVAREKENGVAGWIVSKPVSRWSYLAAKVISLYTVVIAGIAAAAITGYFYTWSLLGRLPASGAALATVGLIGFTLFIASVTFACSTVFKTPLQAGGAAIGIFFVCSILQLVVGQSALRPFYPYTLISELGPLVSGASGPADLVAPLVVTIALSILLVLLSGVRFSRLEL